MRTQTEQPETASRPPEAPAINVDRNTTIKAIRRALKARSGKDWSVTGGRGTVWGWIRIDAPPRRKPSQFSSMTDADKEHLAQLLGLSLGQCSGGVSVPASSAYYREYIQRANGQPVTEIATPYWD